MHKPITIDTEALRLKRMAYTIIGILFFQQIKKNRIEFHKFQGN